MFLLYITYVSAGFMSFYYIIHVVTIISFTLFSPVKTTKATGLAFERI